MSATEAMGRIGIWTGVFDGNPSSVMAEAAAELEQLGFRGLWIPETVGRDPFINAAVILQATEQLNVATGIASIWARDPMTSKALNQSLNEAYDGRFVLGLGVSHHTLVGFVRKHDYSKPYTKMKEYLEAYGARMFRAVGATDEPEVVIAALGPKMLQLAAEQTAGAHPYFVPPEHTVLAREAIGPDSWLAPEQMVVLETDPSTAREIARQHMKVYLDLPNYANNLVRLGYDAEEISGASDRVVDAIVAWGDEDAVKARVQAHLDAGADHVCVQVLEADGRAIPMEGWRRLADALL
ncbi:MAG: LLM class F420-dependent oxidoreductase [Actinomycetota bacterium]